MTRKPQAWTVADFNWTLTACVHYLVTCSKSEKQAVAELERAIGDGEIPHRFFHHGESQQEGDADFWRSRVFLKWNGTEVQAWPKGPLGWGDLRVEDLEVRVPAQAVRRHWRQRRSSKEQQLVLAAARTLFPDGWQQRKFSHMQSLIAKKIKAMGHPVPKADVMKRALGFRK